MAALAAFQIFMRKVGDVTFSEHSGQPHKVILIEVLNFPKNANHDWGCVIKTMGYRMMLIIIRNNAVNFLMRGLS
jgi:hypothetical protein